MEGRERYTTGEMTVRPGHARRCHATSDDWDGNIDGWGMLVADAPILVDAQYRSPSTQGSTPGQAYQLKAHKLDCGAPRGIEFACRMAREHTR